jgi:tRNA A-37 threonylcarbamoyl transferase component Bud32
LEKIVTGSSEQNARILRIGQRHILYDAALIEHPNEALFSPESHETRLKTAEGRGEAIFYEYQGLELVLKHYHRGGMVARLSNDRYLRRRLENTRSFKEWRLLSHLQKLKLPAPVPVAASVIKKGLFYRADLVTKEITNVETFADLLLEKTLDTDIWRDVGSCLRSFHDQNVYHADLNARNILIGDTGIHLIDFDKGAIRYLGDSWKASNLTRLKRSLLKFKSKEDSFHFSEDNWRSLLAGYGAI